jgi:hypothetical protein
MMHMTKGWSGLLTAVIALSLSAWTTTGVKADAMPNLLDYGTAIGDNSFTGGISGTNGGTNVVNFVPIQSAEIDPTSSNIPLGEFQVTSLPSGATTTYDNTPFKINFIPSSYNGSDIAVTPITISGVLNGTINGNYSSNVSVTFNPVADGTFQLNGVPSTLNLQQNDQKLLVPYSAGGTTTLEGTIVTSSSSGSGGSPNPEAAAPEPSTIALFLSTLGGLGLRRYVMSRRRQNKA